jgi:hypothetical protein
MLGDSSFQEPWQKMLDQSSILLPPPGLGYRVEYLINLISGADHEG